jgi:hypothetical protein
MQKVLQSSPVKGLLAGLNTAFQSVVNTVRTLRGLISKLWDAAGSVVDRLKDLVGWIGKIHVPSIPSWLSSHLPWSLELPAAASRFAYASYGGGPLARGAIAGRAGGAAGGYAAGSPTIIVQGALDPEGVARQIKRILAQHDRRQGRTD